MTTFPKEALVEILNSLDHTKDDLWTDDGSPMVAEIQRIANDKTITRAQINDALPGFARKTTESIEEPADEQDDFGDPVGIVPDIDPVTGAVRSPFDKAEMDTIRERVHALTTQPVPDEELSPEADFERLRLIAKGRVEAAETAVTDAKAAVAEAQRGVTAAESRLTRALQLYASKYPPISAAANIKQHLARQQEILRERITGTKFEPNLAQNPVDVTLMDRKRDNGRNGRNTQAPAPFLPRRAAVTS